MAPASVVPVGVGAGLAVVGQGSAAALAAIHAQAFDRPWSEAAFAGLLRDGGALAVARDLTPQGGDGFILLRRALDEAEVLTLAVRPASRRRGIARALVHAAAALLREAGAATLWLEVAHDNAPARALYAACGFAPAGRRPGYYVRDGAAAADALVMRLGLQ